MHALGRKPDPSVAARRALVRDMFKLGLMPAEMCEHLRRELGQAVTPGTIYNDLAKLRRTGRISGPAGDTS